MKKRLAVILGAGASHDVVSRAVTKVNKQWQPPLANGIFEDRESFQAILDAYPKARSLASTIAVRISRGEAMEVVLRDLRDSREKHIVRQFRQVPLYLQHLFGAISGNYTTEPGNYSLLVTRLLQSDFTEVAFMTLNYDLLLDTALAVIDLAPGEEARPKDMSFYVQPGRKWMLVKLHGSANWGREVDIPPSSDASGERALQLIDENAIELDKKLGSEIHIFPGHIDRWRANKLCYPAIAVPVAGKYEYVCPTEHIDALERFLPTCRNFLVVGVSGKDQDLLDLLKANVKRCATFGIVGGDDVGEARARFLDNVPQFHTAKGATYAQGFSQFILDGSLDQFLSQIQVVQE